MQQGHKPCKAMRVHLAGRVLCASKGACEIWPGTASRSKRSRWLCPRNVNEGAEPVLKKAMFRGGSTSSTLRLGQSAKLVVRLPGLSPPTALEACSGDSLDVAGGAPWEAVEWAPPRPPASAGGPTRPPLCCAASTTFHLKITPTCAGKQARAVGGGARPERACEMRAPALLPHVCAGSARTTPARPRLLPLGGPCTAPGPRAPRLQGPNAP